MSVSEERDLVEQAMWAAEHGDARVGHWPTVAGILRDEVLRLRELVQSADVEERP